MRELHCLSLTQRRCKISKKYHWATRRKHGCVCCYCLKKSGAALLAAAVVVLHTYTHKQTHAHTHTRNWHGWPSLTLCWERHDHAALHSLPSACSRRTPALRHHKVCAYVCVLVSISWFLVSCSCRTPAASAESPSWTRDGFVHHRTALAVCAVCGCVSCIRSG